MKSRISMIECYAYLLFAVLFKAYFIPDIIRQAIKIFVLLFLFVFLIKRLNKKEIFNISVLFSFSIIFSGVLNYFSQEYTIKALLDSLLYALSLYDLYTFLLYGHKRGRMEKIAKCFYNMNLIYCILTVCSVAIVGTENNSNVSSYLFGNKFTSSYLFISLVALYGVTHNLDRKMYRIRWMILAILVIVFSLYVDCATATVALVIALMIYIVSCVLDKDFFLKPIVITSILVVTALIPFVINSFMKISFVNHIVFDIFKRGATVYGRFEIYQNYLPNLIRDKFLFGYGYSNGKMLAMTGVFGNAQNGLLEQVMSYGVIGAGIIVFLTFYCIKKAKFNNKIICIVILLYAMIVAAIFEPTINYFFWMALFILRWSESYCGLKNSIKF